ncbi:MAG: ribosomal-processing cysteine protease Prp [Blautia sp.]|nr:ribosomal-processing cysteine protease Prp [Blautia sp.]
MIAITIYQKQGRMEGFHCIGHSGYAASGKDIVCAAVSTLVINTVNAIERFTQARFNLDTEEKEGLIAFMLQERADHDTELLLKTMLLGLQDIQNNYGNEYLILDFKEV